MIKVGIILESKICSRNIFDTVKTLSESNEVELLYLVNSPSDSTLFSKIFTLVRKHGFFRITEKLLFRLISGTEKFLLSFIYEEVRNSRKTYRIDGFCSQLIEINPLYSKSGLVVRYSDNDISKIKSLGLDLLIRGNAPGIFKGEILTASTLGIISFHHGDNKWNRGGPPGFWEVYFRKPSTGFIIQILTDELDGGKIIFRGEVSTKRTYAQNQAFLYECSNSQMADLILGYARTKSLPSPEPQLPYGGELLTDPAMFQSLSYLVSSAGRLLRLFSVRVFLRKRLRWGVAFVRSPWNSAILRKGIRIKNQPNRFFADPFVMTHNGKTVCYVEDYSFKQGRARITAIELIEDDYKILGPVIEESHHLSFPFVFEYKDSFYMIPETADSRSIKLYKCLEFPMKWVYQKDLISNIEAVDPIMFEREGAWWLLFNTHKGMKLHACYSDSPLSDSWTPHESTPLMTNSLIGRNGGLLPGSNRVRQEQGFCSYGAAFSIATIAELTPTTFREEQIVRIAPEFFKNIRGCHHMHSDDRYTVYDFVKEERIR